MDGHCYILVHSRWSLLFPGVLWMVTVISWCALNGRCYFEARSGWSLLCLGAFWMVTVISWCAPDGHCYFVVRSGWSIIFRVHPRWSLLFPGALWMVTVIFGGAMDAKKAHCSTCSPPAARMGRAMACAISRVVSGRQGPPVHPQGYRLPRRPLAG